jgi:hypothetical protein
MRVHERNLFFSFRAPVDASGIQRQNHEVSGIALSPSPQPSLNGRGRKSNLLLFHGDRSTPSMRGPKGRHEIVPTVRSGLRPTQKQLRPEGPTCVTFMPVLRTSSNHSKDVDHDLTVVAIAWRPFGPDRQRKTLSPRATASGSLLGRDILAKTSD